MKPLLAVTFIGIVLFRRLPGQLLPPVPALNRLLLAIGQLRAFFNPVHPMLM
jgi:hypothetical protein